MRVLITGGTGFIGARLATRCVELGQSVCVLAQTNTEAEHANANKLREAGIEIMIGSVTDRDSVDRAADGASLVFHLAAAQHEAGASDRHFHNVNVLGTQNVLDAACAAGITRFVHGSTIGVYGGGRGQVVSDGSRLAPTNIYGRTKLEAERIVEGFRDRFPISVIRISETYGPGDRRLLKLFRAISDGKMLLIGRCDNLHHLVYVDDLVEGLWQAATVERSVNTPVVLAGPEAVTTQSMVTAVAEALGATGPRRRLPLLPLRALGLVMEKTLPLVGLTPPLHRRRLNFFTLSFRFALDEAREAFGYDPKVHPVEGLRATADWYATEGLL